MQTDSWYYTPPGTRRRVGLFDENGERVRGIENKKEAQLALAQIKLAGDDFASVPASPPTQWLVAQVCSEYLQYCERGVKRQTLTRAPRRGHLGAQ